MAGKKFSEMDMMMMELQKIGNDEFRMGFQYPGNSKLEVLDEAIKRLQEYRDRQAKEEEEDAPYGFIAKFEFFKKGEPKNIFE
jgi:hypothetical protein